MKILLIDDDEVLSAVLTKSLAAYRYVVDTVTDGETGWVYGSTFEYDLIMLDIMLPKLDGISLCQRFRAEGYTTPNFAADLARYQHGEGEWFGCWGR